MAEVYNGLSAEQVLALIAQTVPTSFVSGSPMTVAQLLANYPANSTQNGKYARVTDLFGSVDDVMRCCFDGTNYYWRPQRTDYAVANTRTSGTETLTPLLSAPQQVFSGTLLGNMTVALSGANAWPGAQFETKFSGILGLFSITLTGLVGGATLPLLTGGSRMFLYTSAGWREFS